MTQETPVSIDPTLAVALAKAAGLDASGLEEQIRRQQPDNNDPDTLRARIAELDAEINEKAQAEETATTPADPERSFAENYLDALNRSTSPWMGEETDGA